MRRATIDSNIWISAFEYGGTPMRLLRLAVEGDVEIATSQPIIDEVRRVLRDKFGRSEERLAEVEGFMRSFARVVTPSKTLSVIKEDPADDRVLECAVESGSEYIVSGDKDFHRLGEYGGIRVIKVADMLDVIQGKGWRQSR